MLLKRKTRTLCARLSHGCGPSLWAMALAAILASPTQAQFEHIFGKWDTPPGGSDWTHPANPQDGVAVHACHLATGQILVWAYDASYARLWDPNDGSFTDLASDSGLFCAGHAALADGSMLVAGGGQGGEGIWETTIFRLSGTPTGPWEPVADMNFARWYPTCTTLPDGRILAIAGKDQNGNHVQIPEIYDPADDTWLEISGAVKPLPTYPFMFVVPHPDPQVHKVFFAGPRILNYTLDIAAGTWSNPGIVSPFNGAKGAAVMFDGWVLKAGGRTDMPLEDETAWIDLNEPSETGGEWELVDNMVFPRRNHNLVVLPDGRILAVGGENNCDPNAACDAVMAAEWFDPNDVPPMWDELAVMTYERRSHSTAVLLSDGKVLAAGTDDDPDDVTAEIYSPPYLFWGEPPVIGFAPKAVSYGTHFSVILSGASPVPREAIAKVSFVRLAAVTHKFDQDQRYVPLEFQVDPSQSQLSGLIVEAPANANLAPPGYYMLFLISNDGVPSIAKYVRLIPPPASI